jgi:archaellum component FlaF (FlaF/FlaG flagellin family)
MNKYQIKQNWEDVIFFEDSINEFVYFQWYINGSAITNGTGNAKHYSDKNGLDGIYSVRAYRADSTFVETCPLAVQSSGSPHNTVTLTPNPVAPSTLVTVEIDVQGFKINGAEIMIFGEDGRRHETYPVTGTTMTIKSPRISGNYLVRIVDRAGNIYIRKLIVF